MKRIVVILLIVAPLLGGGCDGNSPVKALRVENRKLGNLAEGLEKDIAARTEKARLDWGRLRQEREDFAEREERTAAERGALVAEIEEITQSFADRRAKYREGARAEGRPLGRVRGGSGEIYENAEIVKVTPAKMTFRHSSGMLTVSLESLEPALREQLDFDPAEAALWLEENSPAAPRGESPVIADASAAPVSPARPAAGKPVRMNPALVLRRKYMSYFQKLCETPGVIPGNKPRAAGAGGRKWSDWNREYDRVRKAMNDLRPKTKGK